jgi:hypothetical protein
MRLNKTIDNKKIFTRPDGIQIVDLTQQNFNPSSDATIIDAVKVSKDFEMRPDLVAKTAYGSIDSTDLLLKQSGFSNPFTLEENDIIFLQELREISKQFGNTDREEAKRIVRNQYIDSSKAPELDENLKKFEKREKPKKAPKKSGAPLPPNFAQEGDKEIRLVGGKVIYGGDVTNNKNNQEEPISKSEYLAKLIKDKKKNNK